MFYLLERRVAWSKVFREFEENNIDYEKDEENNIDFAEEDYEKGTSIIHKYFPEFRLN